MGVKVTGQFEPAGDFSIVDGADVSGNITGSNVSASGQLEAGSLGTNLASIISGSTPFDAAAVSGSLGANASLIRSLTATGISGSVTSVSASIATDIKTFRDGTATLVSGSSSSTGSFGDVSVANTITAVTASLWNINFREGGEIKDDDSGNLTLKSEDGITVNLTDTLAVTGGAITATGNISGSSTSTGSFGNLKIAGNSAFGNLKFDTFPYNSNSNSGQFITLKAQDTSDKAILELVSSNSSVSNIIGEIHFINRSSGAGFNPIANITSHFSQGLLFKTQYGNNGEKVGIRITEENNAPPKVIIPSGSLEVKGNISGSSTSTGSFGRLESDTFNTTTFSSTEVTSTNLTVTGTITGSSLDVSGDGIFGGNIRAVGDVIAERYIVSSSVTHLTQSFSSGSTIFGDSSDDTHVFTGSLSVNGNVTLPSTSHKIGIGITPTEELHIGGGTSRTLLVDSTGGTTNIVSRKDGVQSSLASAGGNGTGIIYSKNSGAAQSNYTFFIRNYDTDYLKFDSSGNLEIPVGNISGSSTSTGSFGSLFVKDGVQTIPTKTTFTQTSGIELVNTGNNTVFHIPASSAYKIGTLSNKPMVFFTNNTEAGRFDTSQNFLPAGNVSGSSTSTGSFGTLRVGPISGYGAASGIAFGDGDTAIYEQSNDVLNVKIGAQTKWQFNGDNILSPGTNKAQISPDNGVTSPNFIPGRSHTDTGYGSNGGKMLSLIAGGASILQVSSSGTISGSSTSTGSFGEVIVAGNVSIPQNNFLMEKIQGTGGNRIKLKNSSNGNMEFELENSSYNYVFGVGEVGIGTTNPYYKTHISFSDTDTSFSGGSSGNWGGNGLRIENTNSGVDTKATLQLRAYDYDALISAVKKSGANEGEVHFNIDPDADTNQLLTLAGSKISGSSASTGSFGRIILNDNAPIIGNDGVIVKGASASTGVNFRVRNGSGNDTFRVHGYGAVGIGGAFGDTGATTLHIRYIANDLLNTGTGINEYIRLEDNSNKSGSIGLGSNGNLQLLSQGGTTSVKANSGGTGNFTVDGKVHIGATGTPGEALTVVGNISGSSTSTGSFGELEVGHIFPHSDGVSNIGGVGKQFADLYLKDNGNLRFGNANVYLNGTSDTLNLTGGNLVIATNFGLGLSGTAKVYHSSYADYWYRSLFDSGHGGMAGFSSYVNVNSVYGAANRGWEFHDDNANVTRVGIDSLTGLIKTQGGVSGSSTSTGSFGSVHTTGRVGVGTTAPNSSIHVNASDQYSLIRFTNSGASTGGQFGFTNADAYVWNNEGSGKVILGTNSTARLTITHDAKVGINTGAPTKALTVTGDISASGDFITTSTGSFGRINATRVSASKYVGQIGSRFVHSQTSDSATWVINHNIGHKYPVVTVYDDSDQMILPQNGVANDSDTFTLTFNEAIQGKAVVSVGGIGENAGANFIHYQSDSSTNWRVTHSLSQQYPNVTVYDDLNQVIIPETITAASSNEMDITFSSGKTGYANFSIGSGIPNISAANAGKVLKVRTGGQGVEWSPTSNDVSGSMSVSGSITPTIDNFHNLGSATHRWANLHTGDIQLSNEGSEGNEVDGTTGSWTIQEGEDDLYLLNRKNGKKYKFKLEEIT